MNCASYNVLHMSTLTLRIPESLRKDLKRLSRSRKQPVSDLARDALRRYVSQQRLQELRRMTVPLAEAQGFLTDEDIFKVVS